MNIRIHWWMAFVLISLTGWIVFADRADASERMAWMTEDGVSPKGGPVFTIHIASGNEVVDALGLDVRYDAGSMTLVSVTRGDLLSHGFDLYATNMPTPGCLRLGAADAGGYAIPAGATGVLISLVFEPVGICANADIRITAFKDDLAGLPDASVLHDNPSLAAAIRLLSIAAGADLPPLECPETVPGKVLEEAIRLLREMALN